MQKKKVIVGAFLRPLNVIINMAIAFYMMPLLIHNLGDRMYGFWLQASTIVTYFMMLDMNISSATTRYISRAIGEKKYDTIEDVMSSSILIFSTISIIIVLLTLFIILFVGFFVSDKVEASLFREVIFLLGVAASINFLGKPFLGAANSYFRFDILFYASVFVLVLKSALLIIVVKLGYGLKAMALIVCLTAVVDLSLMFLIYNRSVKLSLPKKITLSNSYVKRILKYSSKAIAGIAADSLRFQVDNFVIAGFVGLSAVTHYGIAATLGRYLMNIIRTSTSILMPVFSQLDGMQDRAKLVETFNISLILFTTITFFLGGGLIIFGKPFIQVWMGKEYQDSYAVLLILITSIIIAMSQANGVRLLFATGNQLYHSLYNLLEGILNLGISLILVRKLGIIGVALGTAISMIFIRLTFHPYFVSKACGIRLKEYFRVYSAPVVKSAISIGLFFFLINGRLRADYLVIFWQAILYSIVFLFVLTLWILDNRERQFLFSSVQKRMPPWVLRLFPQ